MADAEALAFTYVAPFVGALLIALGIGGAVLGGYAPLQQEYGDCGEPTIAVSTPAETRERLGEPGTGPTFVRLAFEDLAPAERRAFEEAVAGPRREARVSGPFENRPAFRNGTVVTYRGERYYATVVAENPCVAVDPLLFPLGLAAILLGAGGVLTPPAYRKLAAIERSRAPPERE